MKSGTATLLLLASITALAQAPSKPDPWRPLEFLVGNWVGEGGGGPGQGSGEFSFSWDLQKMVLVRHNFAEYPATKDKPAYRHDDLMVIYKDDSGKLRADYWDNEGHVIHYAVEQPGPDAVQFVSNEKEGPNYRLTYAKIAGNAVKITFEIAPPGKPFAAYIEARATKRD